MTGRSSAAWAGAFVVLVSAAAAPWAACAAFGDEGAAPGDGGSSDGQVALDGGSDAAPPCVPVSLDADVRKDDNCEPGKPPVDLESSDSHCGVCNHGCGGDGCQGGACVPRVGGLASGVNYTTAAIAKGAVYGTQGPELFRIEGDIRSSLGRPVDAGAGYNQLLLDAEYAYAWMPTVGIHRYLLATSRAPDDVVLDKDSSTFAVVGGVVFYRNAYDNVFRVPPGGKPDPWLAASGPIGAMIADATNLYWTVATGDGGSEVQIRSSPAAIKPSPSNLAQRAGPVSELTADATHLYFTEPAQRRVLRVAKTGGAVETVSRWEGFATVRDLLVDDTHVYWSTVEGLGGFVVIHVQKAKKCGGPPALVMAPVADHPNRVGPMVSAGEYLFYPATDNTNRTFIARVHK